MLTITERRKIFLGTLTPILKKKGYQGYLTGGDPTYVLKDGDLVTWFFFNFKSYGKIDISSLYLTNYMVEDYIFQSGTPTMYVTAYAERKKDHPGTVALKRPQKSLINPILISEEEVTTYAHSYIGFLENEGASFTQQYSHLPNILKEMDRLSAEGKYWHEILAGGPEHLFKGLIISRLCNDPKYADKLSWLEEVFSTMNLDEWQPYWEKLKAILPTIEPKYNL